MAPDEIESISARLGLARQLFATRFAWAALGLLNGSQVEESRNQLRKLHQDVPKGLLMSQSEKLDDNKLRRDHSDAMHNALADLQMQKFLFDSSKCAIPSEHFRGMLGLFDH